MDPTQAARTVWTAYNRGDPQASMPDDHTLSIMRSGSFGHIMTSARFHAGHCGYNDVRLAELDQALEVLLRWRADGAPLAAPAAAPEGGGAA